MSDISRAGDGQGYARPDLLVDTVWVAQHPTDAGVPLVEAAGHKDQTGQAVVRAAVAPIEEF